MFDSLDEQIRADSLKSCSNTERMVRWILIIVVSVVAFGGVYLAVHLMEGT